MAQAARGCFGSVVLDRAPHNIERGEIKQVLPIGFSSSKETIRSVCMHSSQRQMLAVLLAARVALLSRARDHLKSFSPQVIPCTQRQHSGLT